MDDKEMIVKPLKSTPKIIGIGEIVGLNYDLYNLSIGVKDSEGNSILVVFQEIDGFRLLDEGNLLEFWPNCSTHNGWVFEIIKGGWFDLESQRDGFLIPHTNPNAREFLITGTNDCVSIIGYSDPVFVI